MMYHTKDLYFYRAVGYRWVAGRDLDQEEVEPCLVESWLKQVETHS